MTPRIEERIEQLKTAKTISQIARATVALLQACGVFNYQPIAHEMARMCVVGDKQ